jgi:hypothetical protein
MRDIHVRLKDETLKQLEQFCATYGIGQPHRIRSVLIDSILSVFLDKALGGTYELKSMGSGSNTQNQ